VHQQRHHRRAVGVVVHHLFGAHDALGDRVDGFEVARIGEQRDVHLRPPRVVASRA
jgi:hypothetical protein